MLHGLTTFGPMLAAFEIPDWLSSAWNLLLVLFGFSVVVFFHELGHFIAAKWAKVRVERFAVGFGREIVGFTAGETRYSLNALPLGGYVKMLGQEDFAVDKTGELKVRENPDSFTSKPIGKRMVIVSAGVVMNLIFAAVAFGVVMMIGQSVPLAIIGVVDPASAAGRAGVQPGDHVLAINNKPIDDFQDLINAVVLSDRNEELEFTIQRDGKQVEPKPRVLPEYKAEAAMRQIGLTSAMTRRIVLTTSRLLAYTPDDELQPNDLLYKIGKGPDARPVKHFGQVWEALIDARGLPVDLIVKRLTGSASIDELASPSADLPSTEVAVQARAAWQLLPENESDIGSCSLLGLVPRMWVGDVAPNSAAALGGIKRGDVIVRFGAMDNPSYTELVQQIEANRDDDMKVAVRRTSEANGLWSAPVVAFLANKQEELIAVARKNLSEAPRRLIQLAEAQKLSKTDRDMLGQVTKAFSEASQWQMWLDHVPIHELIVRPTSTFRLVGRRPSPTLGITQIIPCEDDCIVAADVRDEQRGRPSPARLAGIPRGAKIVSVSGRTISRWTELIDALRKNAGKEVELGYRVGGQWSTAKLHVPPSISTIVHLPPGARIVEVAGQSTVEITRSDGARRLATLPDWQACEALLRRNVGQSVPVKFRTRDGQAQTATMAVTDENADPWLLRVAYVPSFMCYPLREFHRDTNPLMALKHGFKRAYGATLQTYLTLKHLVFTREVGVENIMGPVGILRKGSQIAEGGFGGLIWFLGLISANLAVINFLPMPIVDGGLFIFLLIEKIRGEPVSIKWQVVTQLIGIALIVSTFLFVTFQDIANWNN